MKGWSKTDIRLAAMGTLIPEFQFYFFANNLRLILESEAQPDAAVDAYRKAIQCRSKAFVRARVGDAIPLLQRAVELAPGNAICRLKLGTAYLRMGKDIWYRQRFRCLAVCLLQQAHQLCALQDRFHEFGQPVYLFP